MIGGFLPTGCHKIILDHETDARGSVCRREVCEGVVGITDSAGRRGSCGCQSACVAGRPWRSRFFTPFRQRRSQDIVPCGECDCQGPGSDELDRRNPVSVSVQPAAKDQASQAVAESRLAPNHCCSKLQRRTVAMDASWFS